MNALGRLVQFDERSRSYPIRALLPDKPRRSYTWSVGQSLDQGSSSACVGFSWTHEAIARPKPKTGLTNQTATDLYHLAQTLDQWEGEYDGTSVLAGAKAAQQVGWIGEYRWAFGEPDLSLSVGYKGPCVLGTYWYTGMDEMRPDAAGRLWAPVTGTVRGGHAYITHGYSVPLQAYKCWNSWGDPSGFWVTASDMVTLLANEGEAVVPVTRL